MEFLSLEDPVEVPTVRVSRSEAILLSLGLHLLLVLLFLFGPGVAGTFSALMAISIVSTVNAMVTIGPRVYYAMAKNKAFFSGAAKTVIPHLDRVFPPRR